jgi:hypothetical protein
MIEVSGGGNFVTVDYSGTLSLDFYAVVTRSAPFVASDGFHCGWGSEKLET